MLGDTHGSGGLNMLNDLKFDARFLPISHLKTLNLKLGMYVVYCIDCLGYCTIESLNVPRRIIFLTHVC